MSEPDESALRRIFSGVRENYVTWCWEWQKTRNSSGYGVMFYRGGMRLAHRVSFELFNGKTLGSLCALHRCDNPCCVNPFHLFSGTRADNRQDMIDKGRPVPAGRGERARTAKLKPADIPHIKELRSTGMTFRAIAARFGLSSHFTVMKICQGKAWKHLTN